MLEGQGCAAACWLSTATNTRDTKIDFIMLNSCVQWND